MNKVTPHRAASSRQRILLATLLLITLFFGAVNLGTTPAQAIGDTNKPIRMTLAELAQHAQAVGNSPSDMPADEDRGAIVPSSLLSKLDKLNDAAASAAISAMTGSAPSSLGGSTDPQTILNVFTTASLNEYASLTGGSLGIPPDTMGAVGPTQFVTHINRYITIYGKDGISQNLALLGDARGILLTNFFPTLVRDGQNPFDTRVRFDTHTNRWILLAETRKATAPASNRLVIAVSDTAVWSASTVFQFFFANFATVQPTRADEADCFYDYPTLGVDEDALYVATNLFTDGTTYPCAAYGAAFFGYGGSSAFVIRKADLLNPMTPADITTYNPGAGNTMTAFRRLLDWGPGSGNTFNGPYMPQGVDNFDVGTNEGYFIGINGCCNDITQVVVRRISNPGGVPTISADLNVNMPDPVDYPIRMPHLGNAGNGASGGRIDVGDGRLMSAHIRDGVLYTTGSGAVLADGTHTAGAGSADLRTGTHWLTIGSLTSTPASTDGGVIYDSTATASNPYFYNYPSIMSSGQGHVALGMSRSSAVEYVGAATVGRLASDPAGTVQGLPILYQAGLDSYNLTFSTSSAARKRWGDYSYTSLDPCDDMTMWTIQEFANTPRITTSLGLPDSGSWGTSVAQLQAPAPSITEVSPSAVQGGQASVVLTLTGTGFYDMVGNGVNPATGCPANPFNVTLSGVANASITNVTWVDADTVNVTIETVGVIGDATGTLTLTNSDGQTDSGTFSVALAGDTIGVKTPATGLIRLRTQNSAGPATYTMVYGGPTDVALAGDWNGDGTDTLGFYRPSTAFFTLSDQVSADVAGIPTTTYNFGYGSLGDQPVVGDWDGNGADGVGVYRASIKYFYLRNVLNGGFANVSIIVPFAAAGDIPLAGDWNGDGKASPGLYRPSTSQFLLTNRAISGTATLDHLFTFGIPNDRPVIGDWDNDGRDSIGVARNSGPSNVFFLRNSIVSGTSNFIFVFGSANDRPIAGQWLSFGTTAPVTIEVAPAFEPGKPSR